MTIVGQREARDYIELSQARAPRVILPADSAKRKELARLEGLLTAGRDDGQPPFSADVRARLEKNIEQRRAELSELARVQVAPPTLLFDRELVLDLGGRRVELRNRGRANSPADVTVYLPQEQALWTGDIVVHPVPYVMASHPVPWISVLREILGALPERMWQCLIGYRC